MEHLFKQLRKYADGDMYPYHMPGHKRQAWGALPQQLYELDITEIEGFDNLHQAEGILQELQKKAARIYGADESFYLVNGSTCGILCAVSSALPSGGHILMNRNCHRSAYHGAYLRNLTISYLWPAYMKEYDIYDAVTAEQIREALEQEPDIGAVLIVSPTYEGRVADVKAIAETVHAKGIPLIVDEAHGAHLGLAEGFWPNSCQAGADLVIHSVHKTLPSLTQTALLHVKGERINRALVKRFLHIYQSSSPSYLLMASIDNALEFVELDGGKAFESFAASYGRMMRRLGGCRHLHFLQATQPGGGSEQHNRQQKKMSDQEASKQRELADQNPKQEQKKLPRGRGPDRQDIGKLLISVKGTGLTGHQLYETLLEKYHLQTEMAAESYVLAMFTLNDGEEAYERMTHALLEIDGSLPDSLEVGGSDEGTEAQSENSGIDRSAKPWGEAAIPLAQAWDMAGEEVLLENGIGRCAGEFVNLYPPGTPLLVPGEIITKELWGKIRRAREQGLTVQGIHIYKNKSSDAKMGSEDEAYESSVCGEEIYVKVI